MAIKLQKEVEAFVTRGDEKVTFTLRQPTNKELNDFLTDRYEVGKRNQMKDHSLPARLAFFNLLLIRVDNLVDDADNPIGPEQKDLIPSTWKSAVIFQLFEDNDVAVKN